VDAAAGGVPIPANSVPQIRVHPAHMEAEGISLMRSDRPGGRLTYTEVGYVPFACPPLTPAAPCRIL